MAAENQFTAGLGRLLAVFENYPQLKADQNVLKLQEQLTTTENQFAFARQAYNDVVLISTRASSPSRRTLSRIISASSPRNISRSLPKTQAVPKVDLSMTHAERAARLSTRRRRTSAMASNAASVALEATNRRETVVLVAVFLVLFTALGFGLDLRSRDLAIVDGHLAGFPVLTIAALVFAGVQSMLSYYSGASLVLRLGACAAADGRYDQASDGARCDQRDGDWRRGCRCRTPTSSTIPRPTRSRPDATRQHSVICVTQGLVEEMDREELQGVIGHEMSHVADYDIRTMMMIAVLVGGIAMLADFLYQLVILWWFRRQPR